MGFFPSIISLIKNVHCDSDAYSNLGALNFSCCLNMNNSNCRNATYKSASGFFFFSLFFFNPSEGYFLSNICLRCSMVPNWFGNIFSIFVANLFLFFIQKVEINVQNFIFTLSARDW